MEMTRQEKLNYIAAHYMRAMWGKAYGVLSDAHEAEDACQEAFIKLIRIADEIDDVESLRAKALCCMVAKNTAIDMGRKNGRVAPTEDVYLELGAEPESPDNPEQAFSSRESVEAITAEIEALPEQDRNVLRLRCLYGFSAEKTAMLLDMNANAVNIRLSRARKRLKERLLRAGQMTEERQAAEAGTKRQNKKERRKCE